MPWRIHNWVLRGVIDNRVRGEVTGQLWLAGRTDAIALRLIGNCRRDLAGCRLDFERTPGAPPAVPAPARSVLAPRQDGVVGDITASRKVKVPALPEEEWCECVRLGVPFDTRMANALQVEWYSAEAGRLVLESVDFKLRVSAPVWTMTAAEEAGERRAARERIRRLLEGFRD